MTAIGCAHCGTLNITMTYHPDCICCETTVYDFPKIVVDAIRRSWPDQADEILASLQHGYDHYFFMRWGMYVGVEYDGYIHT